MRRSVLSILATLAAGSITAGHGALAADPRNHDFPPLTDVIRDAAPDAVNESRALNDPFGIGHYDHLLPLIPAARNDGPEWYIHSTEWTAEDERGYEAFVTAIGRSGCISIDDCLRSPANPYRDLDDEELWLGDCTDMVYVLRGYYAWKNGLPFSYQDAVTASASSERGGDIRYTTNGNRITSRFDVLHAEGRAPRNGPRLLRRVFGIVSTAMLRTDPRASGQHFDDFYPVAINRDAVRPGLVAYDVYGHVSIVYDITPDGRVLMISSHPDYTVSRDVFGPNILRTGPELGSGLKAWRPTRLVGATQRANGTYIGGRITGVRNEDLPDYSLEQYFGTHPDETGDWEQGRFELDGRSLPYYDYVRAVLRDPGLAPDPMGDVANAVDALCEAFIARRTAVNLAVYANIPNEPAPERLPANIYGTYGNWERYSTPSRDARLRTQALELRDMISTLIDRNQSGDPAAAFSGDIAAGLLDVFDRGAQGCRLSYRRTDGSVVRLNLHHVLDRIYDLSFDPFHCPELRWGASGDERATCPANARKEEWYDAQQYLRNDPERSYDLRTDFRATELSDPAIAGPEDGGLGLSAGPPLDILTYLTSRASVHTLVDRELPTIILTNSGAIN